MTSAMGREFDPFTDNFHPAYIFLKTEFQEITTFISHFEKGQTARICVHDRARKKIAKTKPSPCGRYVNALKNCRIRIEGDMCRADHLLFLIKSNVNAGGIICFNPFGEKKFFATIVNDRLNVQHFRPS